jgi:hypothetical protein
MITLCWQQQEVAKKAHQLKCFVSIFKVTFAIEKYILNIVSSIYVRKI